MSDFEKKYYESEKFWTGDVLQDEMNRNRISFTAWIILFIATLLNCLKR